MKKNKGKAIYNPSGRAGEYSYWACNFYVGCSNGCTYCYLKKGIGKKVMGGSIPTLKKCFKDINHAFDVFQRELFMNLPELQKHGLFFTFTSDPCLPETMYLTEMAIDLATDYSVPVKILTKRADWVDRLIPRLPINDSAKRLYAFGFTLTGNNELEPGASTNAERIEAMRKLHEAGFHTWASIEPIIDVEDSLEMIHQTQSFCDLYKVGLLSGREYEPVELAGMLCEMSKYNNKFYLKDSFLKNCYNTQRDVLPSNFVGRDYNIFNQSF